MALAMSEDIPGAKHKLQTNILDEDVNKQCKDREGTVED